MGLEQAIDSKNLAIKNDIFSRMAELSLPEGDQPGKGS